MASVTLAGVRKVFPNGFEAIHDLDLEMIGDGEFIVLVGPSGCGKSTLLRLVAGLEAVSAGAVFIGERDVTDEPPADRDIAMVFQSYALYPHMDVRGNLAFGLRRRRTPREVISEKVGGIAGALGLGELMKRRPGMLSGGQRQRVAIGRAMVREPVVYLMDEPLSNLDAKLRVSMRAELARLHARLGVTTVYVTHDQTEAMTLGDRVCVMLDGVIQQVDTPARLYSAPANAFVANFIGSPAMNLALAAVDGDELVVGGTRLPLSVEQRSRIGTRRQVVTGMRPADFGLRAVDVQADDEAGEHRIVSLAVNAEIVENLGPEMLVVFPVDSPRYHVGPATARSDEADETILADSTTARFTARLDVRRMVQPGQDIELYFDLDRLYLFDADDGSALSLTTTSAAGSADAPRDREADVAMAEMGA